MRAPGTKRVRPAAPATVSARLRRRVRLEAQANGEIVACFDGYSVGLGTFSAAAADRAQELRKVCRSARLRPPAGISTKRWISWSGDWPGTVYWSTASGARQTARTRSSSNRRLPIIGRKRRNSAMPRLSSCRGSPIMRRRGNEMVLELPRAGALFKICDPKIAAAIAMLSTPQQIKELRRQEGFPGVELLALLLDCQILFKVGAAGESGLRAAEGDDSLVLWDFHDLLFHTRSTKGRHANPLGGVYPYVGVIPPLPAVRPRWPGKKIDLRKFSAAHPEATSPVAKLLRERHSTRSFDDQRPITLAELAQFLDGPRASCRDRTASSTSTTAITPSGRILRRAPATSSSSIWPSTNAKGLPAASTITMPAPTRWRRSAFPRMSSKRCWRKLNMRWARPLRRRS